MFKESNVINLGVDQIEKMKKINDISSKIFFTSDQHFGHESIIKFANRPHDRADDMDEDMIRKWNSVVPVDGLTFVLGDIGFCNKKDIVDIYSRLNGRKILIRGNHDSNYSDDVLTSIFDEIHDQIYVRIQDQETSKYVYMVLCHYPMFDWQGSFKGSWQLFGHIHTRELVEFETLRTKLFSTQYDVGVDNNDFEPVSFQKLKGIMESQSKCDTFKTTNYY